MKPTGWLILSLAVLALGEGAWIYSQHRAAQRITAEVGAVLQANAELKGTVDALSQESQTHKTLADQAGQKAEAQEQVIAALKKRVARSQGTTAGPGSAAVPEPSGDDPVAVRDQLIEALENRDAARLVQISELEQALTTKDAALQASETRAKKLEAALVKVPAHLNRAFGVIYGPKTKGISAEMDMGPLRVGVDVVRRPGETEAMARVMWRF